MEKLKNRLLQALPPRRRVTDRVQPEAAISLPIVDTTALFQHMDQVIQKGVLPDARHSVRDFDEQIHYYSGYTELISNEFSLYETVPYIRQADGVIIGAGFDSVLDLFTNSQATDAYIHR